MSAALRIDRNSMSSIMLKRIIKIFDSLVVLVMLALLSACSDGGVGAGDGGYGTLYDARDGKTYRTVRIGSQTWMAENLNFEMAKSYCYADEPYFCSKYGRLYLWSAAMDSNGVFSNNGKGCGHCRGKNCCSPVYPVRGACPEGWHLPSKEEYVTLIEYVGGKQNSEETYISVSQWTYADYLYAGKTLKTRTEWIDHSGTDDYGFSILPSGVYCGAKNEGYDFLGDRTKFFTSSHDGYDGNVVAVVLKFNNDEIAINGDTVSDLDGYSVRCVKD